MNKNKIISLICLLLAVVCTVDACVKLHDDPLFSKPEQTAKPQEVVNAPVVTESPETPEPENSEEPAQAETATEPIEDEAVEEENDEKPAEIISFNDIINVQDIVSDYLGSYEAYSGEDFTVLNDNRPYFTDADLTTEAYLDCAELDELGRCQRFMGCLGLETVPPAGSEREDMSEIHPSGWNQKVYDFLKTEENPGAYLMQRCHTGFYAATNIAKDERILITGTVYFNGLMWEYESQVQDYIYKTGNHVMYRVTPNFRGNELMARSVTMEAYSVEDGGVLQFCVEVANYQPGIELDYATGNSRECVEANAA